MFVPSLLSAFHKHSHRQVLLAQTAAESSFQSCTSKYLGKLNIKFALCKYSCQACRGVQTVRHRNNITGRIKAHQGKLYIQAIAFEVTNILSPPIRITYKSQPLCVSAISKKRLQMSEKFVALLVQL